LNPNGFQPALRSLVMEAVKSLEGAGAKVEGIVGVLDRQEGARQNIEGAGYRFDALFTTADLGI